MYFEQFYLGCLAHASYMLASEGGAVVVDPQRDVEIYLKAAETNQVAIRHVFETHLHADFVSGHRELATRTGARIYIGAEAHATFPHVAVRDGFELKVEKNAHNGPGNAGAYAGKYVPGDYRRRKVFRSMGDTDGRHVVFRRRGAARSLEALQSSATGGHAL